MKGLQIAATDCVSGAGSQSVTFLDEEKKTKHIVAIDKDGE